ncbi:hypothetical protein HMPREF1250_1271 [Megasphaera vaginalis (ex Srinivasan et al. 2021)]|uniref:Uncharacterized protein n=1 Tax=Megasphaera vaginalis (ex Srinivasan et al. 2021) TaxID=1111454 RepID=U7UU91_9FIRM|nr:hypothetical protein HMPREF1250_1271 [Megasphaera vaginalis (ex Srinivasan et al. 2021)]
MNVADKSEKLVVIRYGLIKISHWIIFLFTVLEVSLESGFRDWVFFYGNV